MKDIRSTQFKAALTYITQYATEQELDLFTAVITRRKQRAEQNSTNPERMAQNITRSINRSLDASRHGIRQSLRKYATEIIRQEAPDIPEESLAVLLDSWIPPAVQQNRHTSGGNTAAPAECLPPQALYEMIIQFVSYSLGEMTQEEYRGLTAAMGDWVTRYWKHFPVPVKHEIKAFLNGDTTAGDFDRAIQHILTANR